jgi:S1-C subfamily serine protease
MSHTFLDLSSQIADAVERASPSVVQVVGRHRPATGVGIASGLIATLSRAVGDEAVVVRSATGQTGEGLVLGQAHGIGLSVIRTEGLDIPPLPTTDEPRTGQLAIAVGRTWSGGVMASLTNIAVVGGPLRTGRATEIPRVIRIAEPPHGAFTGGALVDGQGHALGIITGSAIRGTAVVLPAAHAWRAGESAARQGGSRQGFIGLSTLSVALPPAQRAGGTQAHGLLVTGIVDDSPASAAGLLVGDLLLAFEGTEVDDAEALVLLLRGDRVGKPVTLSVVRGTTRHEIAVTPGDRPRPERPRHRER